MTPDSHFQMNLPYGLPVERCNGGQPIIAPTSNHWESGVTFNSSAVYLSPTAKDAPIIQALLPDRDLGDSDLASGIVAIHYRARPEDDPGKGFVKSTIGLAVFTPAFKLLKRWAEPVIVPSDNPSEVDFLGIEDPRITRFGDTFSMIYCGVKPHPDYNWQARLCMAQSIDLLHWEKLGMLPGDPALFNNKDGVLFPQRIHGRYYLLHRPFGGHLAQQDYAIHLAESFTLSGPWKDLGSVLHSYPNPRCHASWVGAGSVPIDMGGGRFAVIYHTGNTLNEDDREYDLDAALIDFNRLDPQHPESIVTGRIEPLMVPENEVELRSRSALQVGNVLFACGSYEYQEDIYIIYGGADTYTLAARVNKGVLFQALENATLTNPFKKP